MGITHPEQHLPADSPSPVTPPAGASYLTPNKKYKWIAKEIDRLNVETDYARIWSLTTIYYGDDVLVNLLYATGMPNFVQNPFGSDLLINRTKKAKDKQDARAWDTLSHFWRWFEYGPDHIDAQRSIEAVNRIHVALSKKSPAAFPEEDFIFTTAWLGTYLHRLRELVGLEGFNAKQKAAAHLFWQNLTLKLRGPDGYVTQYPESFEAMEQFVDDFVARPRPQTDAGRELGKYVIEQFNRAQLPRPLWPVGRQICLTVQSPEVRYLHRMGDPNPVAAFLIKKVLHTKIWAQEKILPDPRQNTPEKARAAGNTEDQHREPRKVPAAQCPFHSA